MNPLARAVRRTAALLAAVLVLCPTPALAQRSDNPDDRLLIDRPLDSLDSSVQLQIDSAARDIAIGDVFRVVALVSGGSRPGEQIDVVIKLGERTLTVPARRVSPDGAAPVADETGPWTYRTGEIEVFAGPEGSGARRLAVEYRDATQTRTINGITGPALVSLLESYLERARNTRDPLEALALMENVWALLAEAQSPSLYRYAAELALAGTRQPNVAALMQAHADDLLGTSDTMLNQQLRGRLDKLAAVLVDDDGKRDTSSVALRRGLVLLKETAIQRGVERLVELNRWKRGAGVINKDTFLSHSLPDALSRVRGIRRPAELARFLQFDGIANGDAQLQAARAAAAAFARRNQAALEGHWARMTEARTWYNWASNRIELVFDYEPSRRRYAEQYSAAQQDYNALLREHALLRTMVDAGASEPVPLWKAIAATPAGRSVDALFDSAVATAESAAREMLNGVVAMRSVDDLVELGSPRFRELHTIAENSGAPTARALVGLATGAHQERIDGSIFKRRAAEFGLGVVQVAGVWFPPAFYASTALLLTMKGDTMIAAYGESAQAEAAEAAGVGSRLDADNARRHFRNSAGDFVLEGQLGMLGASAIRRMQAAERAGAALSTAELKLAGNEIKQTWAVQRRFELGLAEKQATLKRAETLAENKRAVIADWDRKIKDATRRGNEPLRNQRMASRAEDHLILLKHNELVARTRREIAALVAEGPRLASSRTFYAVQGGDVERANGLLFWQKLAENPQRTGVRQIGERRFQLGERIDGTVAGVPRQRYEVRFNETIVDAQGRTIKPPERVQMPGEAAPVRNPEFGGESMRFDRIVIDHKQRVIYLDDLVRTSKRKHLVKTHSYAPGLEQMFPGYQVAGVSKPHAGTWPRDVSWGAFQGPISAITADLREYKVVGGESVMGR